MKDTIEKYAGRISQMKHIDAKALAINYLFPLLRDIAEKIEDQESDVEQLFEAINYDSDYQVMREAQEAIIKLATFADRLMVVAGYFTDKMQPTDKFDGEVRSDYEEVAQLAASSIAQITKSLDAAEDDDEDYDDEEDDEEDDGDDGDDAASEAVPTDEGAAHG